MLRRGQRSAGARSIGFDGRLCGLLLIAALLLGPALARSMPALRIRSL